MTTEATTDKTAETTDTTKAAETTTQSTTAATTEAAKTADTATTTTETKVANEAVKEFVADPKKSDAENAAALAAFEKADTKAEKPGLPDDWRETAAAGDADLLKLAKRYGSLSGMLKALDESKKALRSGKVKAEMPDPTDEKAMAEWRKTEGIPADPTGYVLPETIQKRLVDEDKPILSSFTEFAHAKNAPPAFVEMAADWYINMQEAAAAKQSENDKLASSDAEDALRKDWAHGEYKANTTMGKRWLDDIPGVGAKWAEARVDGKRLGDIPEFIAWAAERGREKFGDMAFTTTDSESKHTARRTEIEKIMNTDIDRYHEEKLDVEYAAILEKDLKRRK